MIFNWVVHRIGFLKHIPLLAMVFDSWLAMWNAIWHPEVLNVIDKIEATVETWQGIEFTTHKFGGLQLNYGAREIGHIHSNGIVDISFPKKIRDALIETGRAEQHHIFTRSGWISFYIQKEQDYDAAIALLRLSYEHKQNESRSEFANKRNMTRQG